MSSGLLVDVAELGVAVRVLPALEGLDAGLQAEALLTQQVPDRVRAHPVPLTGELGRQDPGRLHRPAQRRHRITPFVGFHQGQQRGPQPRIKIRGPLPATTGPAHPAQRFLAGLQLVHALADRRLADPCRPRDRPDTAVAQEPGLGPHHQPPLPLVEMREQHLEPHSELTTNLVGDAHTTTTSRISGSNTLILCEPLASTFRDGPPTKSVGRFRAVG